MTKNRVLFTMFAAIALTVLLIGQIFATQQTSTAHAQAGTPNIDFDTIANVPEFLRAVVTQAVIDRSSTLPNDDLFYSTSFRFSDEGDKARILLVPAYVIDANWENLAINDTVEIWLTRQSGAAWTIEASPASSEASVEYRFPWTEGHTWNKNGGFHQGLAVDFQPQQLSDTTVLAASDGKLNITCEDVDGQTWVSVGSAIYGHLDADSIPSNLIGKQVQRGQKIGEFFDPNSGGDFDTRCGEGEIPHLHFVFPNVNITMYDDDPYDPRDISASEMGIDTGNGAVWYKSNNTLINAPDGFNKTSPANGAQISGSSVTLEWNPAVPGPNWYRYCLKAGQPCNGNGDDAWAISYTPFVTRTDLLPNTTYFWEVQAKYGTVTVTANGGWWSFTVGGSPSTPTPTPIPTPTLTPTSPPLVNIMGFVGIAGVTMDVDGCISNQCSTTSYDLGASTNYSIPLPVGWSGTITPRKTDFVFSPPSRSYTITQASNVVGQNYQPEHQIRGNVGVAGVTLSYWAYGAAQTVLSDSNGGSIRYPGTAYMGKYNYTVQAQCDLFSPVQSLPCSWCDI